MLGILSTLRLAFDKLGLAQCKQYILNFLFPQKCIGCGLNSKPICQECLDKIDYPSLPRSAGQILVATDYNDPVAKKAIWLLKYQKTKTLAEPLAELIYRRTSRHLEALLLSDKSKASKLLIIPIPLSRNRLRERGYNQSELIAKYLNSKMSIRIATNVLYKINETKTQVSIKNREERLKNLEDSFIVKNHELIKDNNIILVDDVTTTGTTIKEAGKILKDAGAKKITAVVVARR